MKHSATATVFVFVAASASRQTRADALPFRDRRSPIPARVDDLISRVMLEEKAAQLYVPAAAVLRLGIPAFTYSRPSVRTATVRAGESAAVTVTFRNTGDRAGNELAQL